MKSYANEGMRYVHMGFAGIYEDENARYDGQARKGV